MPLMLYQDWRLFSHLDQRSASLSGRLWRTCSKKRRDHAPTREEVGSLVSFLPWICGCGFLIPYQTSQLCSTLKTKKENKKTALAEEKISKTPWPLHAHAHQDKRATQGAGPRRGAGAPPPFPHPTPPRRRVTDSSQPLHVNQPFFSHSLHLVINLNTDIARVPFPRPSGV